MANTRKANVLVCDTTGTITQQVSSCFVLYVPGTGSPAASIAAADGTTVWEVTGSTRIGEEVEIKDPQGVQVTLAGTGTKLYIYLD